MLVYNVFNYDEKFIGKFYVEKTLSIEEEKNELSIIVKKILKDGLFILHDKNKIKENIMGDKIKEIKNINQNTFWALENELIKNDYIVEEVSVEEV